MRLTAKKFWRAVLLILCAAIIAPHKSSAETHKYKIGVIAPLSGDFAKYGTLVRQGIEQASRPEIEWVFEDEVCEPAKAVAAYHKLTAIDGVSFIIGPCCGSPQKAIAPLLRNKKQLILLPTSAPSSVFEASNGKMYSAQYSIDAESTFLAQQMNDRGLKKAAIIYTDNDFSETHEAAFRKAFKGEVVYVLRAPAFDAAYMKDAALALQKLSFDSIYIPDAAPLLLGFLTELKKIGVEKRPVFSVYSAQMPDVLKAEGAQAEGLLYSYPDVTGDADAVGYFPKAAAQLLSAYVVECRANFDCVAGKFKSNSAFQSGSQQSGIILKTVRNGTFAK